MNFVHSGDDTSLLDVSQTQEDRVVLKVTAVQGEMKRSSERSICLVSQLSCRLWMMAL